MNRAFIFGAFITAMMCLIMTGVTAAETTNLKTTVTTSLRGNAAGAITVSADSPFVQEHLRRMKEKNKKNKKITKNKRAKNRRLMVSARARLKKKNQARKTQAPTAKPEIIQLRTAESIPPVVNKTSRFVFRDITQRKAGDANQFSDLEKRKARIEALRQASVQR